MQDRPHASELLQVVGDFLEEELLPSLDGPLRYRSLVALNLTRILHREQQQGVAYLLRERDRLCTLLELGAEDLLPGPLSEQVEDLNQQLVMELGDDADPAFVERARQALLAITVDKLAIVRPGYEDYDGSVDALSTEVRT